MQEILATRGEDLVFTVPITDDRGLPVPVTEYTFTSRIRTREGDATLYAFGITKIQNPNHLIQYRLTKEITAAMMRHTYLVDTIAMLPNSDVTIPENLKFILRLTS